MILLCGIGPAVAANATSKAAATYTNPIINKNLADPCLVLDGDHYYLFATGGAGDGRFIPIYRSKDLVHWEFVRGAVSRGKPTDWNYIHFWAPEVVRMDGRYYLYYTASPEVSPRNSGNRVGLAVADHIEGPYKNVGSVIKHASIDGHPFTDRDGQLYMLYTIEHGNADGLKAGRIYIDRMLSPAQAAGKPVPIMTRHPWQEGPWLQIKDGRYYLTYSCGNWKNASYHVRAAIGSSPTGPFKELKNVVLKSTKEVKGPGHHSMFVDRDGQDWIVYHGWDPSFKARYPRIDRVFFQPDSVTSDGPTSTAQRIDK